MSDENPAKTDTETRTVTLDYPINSDQGEVIEITIPRLKARDLRIMDKERGDVAKMIALLSKVTGISRASLGNLDAADYAKISEAMEYFLGGSQ